MLIKKSLGGTNLSISFKQPKLIFEKNNITISSELYIKGGKEILFPPELYYDIKHYDVSKGIIEFNSLDDHSLTFYSFPVPKEDIVNRFKTMYDQNKLQKDALFLLKEFEALKSIKNEKDIILIKEDNVGILFRSHIVYFTTKKTDKDTIFKFHIMEEQSNVIVKMSNKNKDINFRTDFECHPSSDEFYPIFKSVLYNCKDRIRLFYKYQK